MVGLPCASGHIWAIGYRRREFVCVSGVLQATTFLEHKRPIQAQSKCHPCAGEHALKNALTLPLWCLSPNHQNGFSLNHFVVAKCYAIAQGLKFHLAGPGDLALHNTHDRGLGYTTTFITGTAPTFGAATGGNTLKTGVPCLGSATGGADLPLTGAS